MYPTPQIPSAPPTYEPCQPFDEPLVEVQKKTIVQGRQESGRSIFGMFVHTITNPTRLVKGIEIRLEEMGKAASAFIKDLANYTIHTLKSIVVMMKSTAKYAAYGAAVGLISGALFSASPATSPMAAITLPFALGCGATAGAVYGSIKGYGEGVRYFDALQAEYLKSLQKGQDPKTSADIV